MNNRYNNWINLILLSTLWVTTPHSLFAQSSGQMCADVITYGKNPNTGEWQTFSTPCAVPQGWQSSPVKPNSSVRADPPSTSTDEACAQNIVYGKNPETGEWVEYSNPCVVPQGWETSYTKPDTGSSSVQPDNTSPSGNSGSGDNTSSKDQGDCTKQEIIYAQHPTSKKWYIFTNSCEVPTGWTNSKMDSVCADVIVYGQSPKMKKWYPFATPCDIPTQPTPWEWSLLKQEDGTPPGNCAGSVAYAKNPKTGNAYWFSVPCDVPEGWDVLPEKPSKLMPDEDDVKCPPVITYAQSADKKTWYAFSSVCEVPEGWIKSATPPPVSNEEDCSSVKVTYSQEDRKVHIPFIFFNNTDTQPALKEAELELVSIPSATPFYLFFLSKVPETVTSPEENTLENPQP